MTQAAMNAMELNMNDMTIISGGELTEVRKQTLLGLMKISKKLATSKEHVLEWCRTNGLDQEENDNDHPRHVLHSFRCLSRYIHAACVRQGPVPGRHGHNRMRPPISGRTDVPPDLGVFSCSADTPPLPCVYTGAGSRKAFRMT